MGEFVKDNYFIMVRIMLGIIFCMYGLFERNKETGVSVWILLLVSLYISLMAVKELLPRRFRLPLLLFAAIVFLLLYIYGSSGFLPVGYLLCFEYLLWFKAKYIFYFLTYGAVPISSSLGYLTQFLMITLLITFYLQHEFIVSGYRKQVFEDTVTQQEMKRDIRNRESAAKAELKKNMVMAENHILEERANLSQMLHDKLGHNINGSIYQLEAGKVIMDQDPEKAREMIQSVIDQLRTGMDEIRGILRKERPEKKKMALLQLYQLCADCNQKGVEAELSTEGELSSIDSAVWEILLDNAFEAVTNAMKYAKCKHINIFIRVLNRVVRCTVSDDGIGCDKIEDGMGISGMRQRVRSIGGTITFESEAGFQVTMLLPLKEREG